MSSARVTTQHQTTVKYSLRVLNTRLSKTRQERLKLIET